MLEDAVCAVMYDMTTKAVTRSNGISADAVLQVEMMSADAVGCIIHSVAWHVDKECYQMYWDVC